VTISVEFMHTIDTNGGFVLVDYINAMAAKGRSSFSYKDIEKQIKFVIYGDQGSHSAVWQKKGEIAMPYRGFYVIVPTGIPGIRMFACGTIYSRLDELL